MVIKLSEIKLVIINQSPRIQQFLNEALNVTERFDVIGIFNTIDEGKEFCELNRPNVILLDVNLIELNLANPIPIILISDYSLKNTFKTVQAINRTIGVIDYVKLSIENDETDKVISTEAIILKIINASNVDVSKNHKRMKDEQAELIPETVNLHNKKGCVIGIGTSTGGPQALHTLLSTIPSSFEPPIFIVQHMPKKFTKSLAERLNSQIKLHVKEAEHGEIVQQRTVYIAPGDYHMKVVDVQSRLKIALTQEPKKSGHRPSVDVLFESLANIDRVSKVTIVLTGMGKDGSEGIKQIRKKDPLAITIAESNETALIYGMPKAAIETGEIQEVIRLEELSKKLINYVKFMVNIEND